MRGIAGKVAVVTGASGGIGAATARRLADEGARVVAVDLDEDGVRGVASALPTEAIWVRADVSAEEGVSAYLDAALERFGRVDLHHLNAGIAGSFATLPELTVAEFDRVMAVNVRGVFLGVRAAFRQYAAQGGAGSIVITGSIGSLRGSADLLAYQTSKHAVLGILRGAAMYGGPLGVRVNAVAPGIVPTDLFAATPAVAGGRDDMTRRASSTPLRRAGTGDDVAGVVAFLLSDDAAYMTGEVVSVDGGASIVSTVRPSGGAGAWDFEAYDRALYGIS
ncbi:glucose 1-dehydrogenase [Dactylosporangium sp. AC04546]|uniref:SDR family NAD(P)-dependent oxidoreductase n=1 Tax=Dactylosporangium sp. AC04546 TaxID=2862460 RepID=UPI001EDCAC90|nr:glucose 1-dehydrogenase [Dactylosporangium sp. AC04546]WVK89135.1 glucose 1-dehydrogenase [Dactylosporangium sp. AC04546]